MNAGPEETANFREADIWLGMIVERFMKAPTP